MSWRPRYRQGQAQARFEVMRFGADQSSEAMAGLDSKVQNRHRLAHELPILQRFIEMLPLHCYFCCIPAPGLCGAQPKEDTVLLPHAEAAMPADDRAGLMTAQNQPSSEELLARILSSLADDKAEDVVQIDLRGKTAIGDYMVIASGRSTRQVSAIADNLVDCLKQEFGRLSKTEGKDTGDWVLIDTGDVIIHIFRPEVRAFYQLEKMWLPDCAAPAN
jgi:ribosome-associated protein